ncbi:hypothetical protein EC968_006405 [Mortierella alpina]|nr:hypothetical protein EC968_006405 [Mortierella alpina]
MATAALSAHSFARCITSALDQPRAHPSHGHPAPGDPQGEHDHDPATTDDLMLALSTLDTEIQSTKAQVYKKLLANYSAFSESFEYSVELKDKIDELLTQADNMTAQTTDPEASYGRADAIFSLLTIATSLP